MQKTREKTLIYRRAIWISDVPVGTLEQHVRASHKVLKNMGDRFIRHGDQVVRSAKTHDKKGEGIFLHLTAETPGETASIVPKVSPQSSGLDLQTAAPPSDGEWLDGDAFLFISDNHVCMCATSVRDSTISNVLRKFLQRANLGDEALKFDLMRVADISRLKMIQSEGVKEIQLSGVMYQATAEYIKRKATATGVLGAVARHMRAILDAPNDVNPDALRVAVTIRTDRRSATKAVQLGEKRIERIALDVLKNAEDGDEYTIITGSDQKITEDEIFVKMKAHIESDGKTVRCDHAWQELARFYRTLSDTGALEQ